VGWVQGEEWFIDGWIDGWIDLSICLKRRMVYSALYRQTLVDASSTVCFLRLRLEVGNWESGCLCLCYGHGVC